MPSKDQDKPLADKELRRIERMVDTRFDCDFWRPVTVRWVIKRLLEHIEYLQNKLKVRE